SRTAHRTNPEPEGTRAHRTVDPQIREYGPAVYGEDALDATQRDPTRCALQVCVHTNAISRHRVAATIEQLKDRLLNQGNARLRGYRGRDLEFELRSVASSECDRVRGGRQQHPGSEGDGETGSRRAHDRQGAERGL